MSAGSFPESSLVLNAQDAWCTSLPPASNDCHLEIVGMGLCSITLKKNSTVKMIENGRRMFTEYNSIPICALRTKIQGYYLDRTVPEASLFASSRGKLS